MVMKYRRLPLREQVIAITGASSGIGLVTAKRAASRGARVVLAARNENDLRAACDEIRREGGRAVYVVADVTNPNDVAKIAETAIAEFGRIDTWVNNAAVSMHGKTFDIPIEDMRRQMDVNFWGHVYGSREAVRLMRDRGGALVNVASGLADRAIPLQGIDCAAQYGVTAFTDALRMELESDGIPVNVSLVKPASIDTADVILRCAEKPTREMVAGGAADLMRPAATVAGLVALMFGAFAIANRHLSNSSDSI
jgi:NAD(P)-dependent dehydrogenase (short-subunit alcohol dehydrogenase family)